MDNGHKDICNLWKLEFLSIIFIGKLDENSYIKLKKGNYELSINKYRDKDFMSIYLNYKVNNIHIYVKRVEILINENYFKDKRRIIFTYLTGLGIIATLIHKNKEFKKVELNCTNSRDYIKINNKKNTYNRVIKYEFGYHNFYHDITPYETSILKMQSLFL